MVVAGDPASFLLFWNPQLLFQLLFFSTNCSERFLKVKPLISPLLENHCSHRNSDTSWTEHPSKKYGFWQILHSSIVLQPLVALVKLLFGPFGFALLSCWWQDLHRVSLPQGIIKPSQSQVRPSQVQTNSDNVQIPVPPHQLDDRDERIHLALLLQSLLGCQSIVSLYFNIFIHYWSMIFDYWLLVID